MLLCDFAEAVNGKLYIMGGGWTTLLRPNVPTNMVLAVKLDVPWDQTNRKHTFRASLLSQDSQPITNDQGEPIEATGEFEVGRPPGTRPGSSITMPFVIPFGAISLSSGAYRWQFDADDDILTYSEFEVLMQPPGGSA